MCVNQLSDLTGPDFVPPLRSLLRYGPRISWRTPNDLAAVRDARKPNADPRLQASNERSLCLGGDGAGTSVIARLFGKDDQIRLATV